MEVQEPEEGHVPGAETQIVQAQRQALLLAIYKLVPVRFEAVYALQDI